MNLNKVYNNYSSLSENGDYHTPIYLHINSYGGDTDAALAVIDTMESLKNKGAHIITIIEGNNAKKKLNASEEARVVIEPSMSPFKKNIVTSYKLSCAKPGSFIFLLILIM